MNKNLYLAAFATGLLAVGWVGVGYIGNHPLAFSMTAIIGVVYVFGALELKRFHQATSSLAQALETIPESLTRLDDWLLAVHPSLQNAVRLRIEGERVGMPGPAVTPYLVGLLVMLGMLGTFLGMVVTLNGAVIALESTTDLQTIRASLAAPVKGLGLAFGTSVAGVAASAMLGLISSLCRRERLQAAQKLDTRIATVLRGFSLVHQRQETFKALQFQSQALPQVVDKLQAMMDLLEQRNQQLNERLLAGQENFHRDVRTVYADLAVAVDQSLRSSLQESARLAGETIRPAVETTMAGIAAQTANLQDRLAETVSTQLDGLSSRFDRTVSTVADTWTQALAGQERSNDALVAGLRASMTAFAENFEQRSAALLANLARDQAVLQADLASRDEQRLAALSEPMQAMATSLQREWQQVGAQTLAQQQEICRTLAQTASEITEQAQAQASRTIGEIAGLMEAAAEAPRAAAEVIGQLRQEVSNGIARDNALLEERSRMMESLGALLDAINHASVEQRGVIDSLVSNSALVLERVSTQFTEKLGAESERMGDLATRIGGGAVEVASLSEAFGFAVQQFSQSNDKMIASLERIETSLDRSIARSDEQLAYYVAQAREIIDLSIMAQKKTVDDLQRIASRPLAGEVA